MKHLLLVSEDEGIIHSIKILLKNYIVENVSPDEVIQKINEWQPFLIFVDTYLNEVNPCELIDRIYNENKEIFIVPLISSYDKTTREILEKDVFDIVEKPFLFEKIRYIVKKAEKLSKFKIEKIYKEEGDLENKEEKFLKEKVENQFFQSIFQSIAENFSDIKKICFEILKIMRRYFHFNCGAMFLKEGDIFKIFASIGIDEKICNQLCLDYESEIIKWFIKESKIIDERSVSSNWELKNFSLLLKAVLIIPLKTFNGKLVGFLCVGEKSTNERIRNEEISLLSLLCDYLAIVFDNFSLYNEIACQKKYQEFLFENLPAGIIGVDKDGKINLLNDYGEKILKVKYEEIKGLNVEKVGSQIADLIRRALLYGENTIRKEINFIPTKRILGISTNVIRDESGNVIGAVAIFSDITKVKEIERREKEIERNRFWTLISSKLSHELKNPLVAINTFAQMLPTMYEDKEFREKFSIVVSDEIKKINEIINMINKIGEEIEIREEKFYVNEFIEEFLNEKRIERKYSQIPKRIVKGDILRLKEAVNYLIEVIKEDIDDEEKIYFDVIEKEDALNLIFFERGKKLNITNDEEIFFVFNPKFKTTLSVKMLLAKKIIENHNGKLEIKFTPSGKSFIINLPLENA